MFPNILDDCLLVSNEVKILLAQREKDYLLFLLGINLAYGILDLIRVQFHHLINEKKNVRSYLSMIEQKTN